MKTAGALFVLTLAILSPALPARAGDKLLIFSDAAFTDSTLNDNAPRIANLYVLHTGFDHSIAVRFATKVSPGFTGVWLGDTSSYYKVGQSPIDVGVHYGTCIPPRS